MKSLKIVISTAILFCVTALKAEPFLIVKGCPQSVRNGNIITVKCYPKQNQDCITAELAHNPATGQVGVYVTIDNTCTGGLKQHFWAQQLLSPVVTDDFTEITVELFEN